MSARRPRVLLVKPYQPAPTDICQPPLGILYLVSALRRRFGTEVEVAYRDLRLGRESPEAAAAAIAGRYDLVGISALNCEAQAVHALARAVRAAAPRTIVALGGPYAHGSADQAMALGGLDWIFDGEADRTFAQAVEARFFGDGDLSRVAGLSWRAEPDGPFVSNGGRDWIPDLDALPKPAWDLVPFDAYARRHNMNGSLRERRYAPLFTSRGCPYRCHYCHDLFSKSYRWRSPDDVLAEIDELVGRRGVREFQIVDDIFNLHKPRMREIARAVIARHGRRALHFAFPNGVRADIIDPADLPLLRDMGVYDMSVAVETVSPRLQGLIDKNLDVGRARRVIAAADAAGISLKGFFMLGFPTETRAEIESTVRFALESELTIAHFFFVIPQPGTPLYELARREGPRALEAVRLRDYNAERPWYELAYGVDMNALRRDAARRFYLTPSRLGRVLRRLDAPTLRAILTRGAGGSFHALANVMPSAGRAEPARSAA